MVLVVILISILVVVLWLGFSDAEARRQAEYDVRELAGELTPAEIRAEVEEDATTRERRMRGMDAVEW